MKDSEVDPLGVCVCEHRREEHYLSASDPHWWPWWGQCRRAVAEGNQWMCACERFNPAPGQKRYACDPAGDDAGDDAGDER